MPKLKKKLTGNFTIINNTVLRDKRMGCTERGLMLHWYLWLMTGTSRSEVWQRSCPTVLPRSQVHSKGWKR